MNIFSMGEENQEPKPKKGNLQHFAKEGVEASGPREKDPRKKSSTSE